MQIIKMAMKGETGNIVEIEAEDAFHLRITYIYTDRPREIERVVDTHAAGEKVAEVLYGPGSVWNHELHKVRALLGSFVREPAA